MPLLPEGHARAEARREVGVEVDQEVIGVDLVVFIRARLTEQAEALTRLIHYQDEHGDVPGMNGGWELWGDFGRLAHRTANFRQMLRAVEAEQRVLADWEGEIGSLNSEYRAGLYRSLRHLGTEWSTHPEYREEWTP